MPHRQLSQEGPRLPFPKREPFSVESYDIGSLYKGPATAYNKEQNKFKTFKAAPWK